MSTAKKSKVFRYQLETVLKVREIREKQEQEKFKKAEEKLKDEIEKEEKMKQVQIAAYTELHSLMSSYELPDMNVIKIRKIHLERLDEQVKEQTEKRKEAERARDHARDNLNKAVKERKIIEKDKEKTREKWRKIMDKEDNKFMDDIAGIRFNKQSQE